MRLQIGTLVNGKEIHKREGQYVITEINFDREGQPEYTLHKLHGSSFTLSDKQLNENNKYYN